MDQRLTARRIDLSPQVAHVHVDEVVERFDIPLPHLFRKARSADDFARPADQKREDRLLRSREIECATGARHTMGYRVEREIRHAEQSGARDLRAT